MTTDAQAADTKPVALAINRFGLELLRAAGADQPGGNALFSPYSIEQALAMAYLGADGETRAEMQRVLHLPPNDDVVLAGLAGLVRELEALPTASRHAVAEARTGGESVDPIELHVANRLFAQSGYAIRPAFAALLRERFAAPLEELDFKTAPEPARGAINGWVARRTRDKIRNLIPAGGITGATRAVLTNALYLRAGWMSPFSPRLSRPEVFWIDGKTRSDVPTMQQHEKLGHAMRNGYTSVSLPYCGGELQLVVVLPDRREGLAEVEQGLTGDAVAAWAGLPRRDVILHLPKFKLEPPSLALGEQLRALGMRTAFDRPRGSADFSRMAPRTPEDYLTISEVFHQTWLALDENGTEAAAATATAMAVGCAVPREPPPPPVEVRVDHPFLFAIQHVPSGACLFLGRVVDPR